MRIVRKEPCHICRGMGNDAAGDNLKIYEDGHGYCFACKTSTRGGDKPVARSKLTIAQVQEYPIGGDPDKLISLELLEEYGIHVAVSEVTGEVATIYYPHRTDGVVTGYKVKNLPKDFRPSVGVKPSGMFGKESCKFKGRLIITEGEEDVLATREILKKCSMHCDVVSLPNGSSVDDAVRSDLTFFEKYKRIYIAMDCDIPGRKVEEDLADWLSPVADIRIIKHEIMRGKDASDYWTGGHYGAYKELIRDAEVYEPEGVVNGVDILLKDLLKPMPEGHIIPFSGLQDKLHGVRKGEILTVCAGSGIGKSTLVREITKSLIDQDLSVANVALEDQMNVAAQALIALDMDIPLARFRFDPPTEEESEESYRSMVANGKTYFYKHFGGLTSDTLMNKMYYYAKSKACDFIVLDHLSMVISSSTSTNERKDIDTLMTNLAKMVVETGVGLIQIVHLKRKGDGTSYAHGGEVELSDLRGSAALEQLSWAVVGMERDQQGDDRDFSTLRILKNRTWGFTGKAGMVKYDPLTGRMKDVKSEIPDLDIEELEDVS